MLEMLFFWSFEDRRDWITDVFYISGQGWTLCEWDPETTEVHRVRSGLVFDAVASHVADLYRG